MNILFNPITHILLIIFADLDIALLHFHAAQEFILFIVLVV